MTNTETPKARAMSPVLRLFLWFFAFSLILVMPGWG